MNKRCLKRFIRIVKVTTILTVLLIVSAISCTPQQTDSGKIVVAVTLLPQAGFVEAIGGDKVEVVVMVPPGASPHTYEVTPDQMTRLSRAKMYGKVGSPVEFELAWMDKLIAANKTMLVVDCCKGIQLMQMTEEEQEHEDQEEQQHEHEGLDPHIWLSVRNARVMVQNVYEGLIQVDGANKSYYEKNYTGYVGKLTELDSELAASLADVKNRNFIVFHPAFGYFARDYDLKQIAVEQGGKEPSADYIVRLIKQAKEQNIRVVFVSPQYSTKSAEMIAQEIRGKVVIIDPLAKDFISNMQNIAAAMKQAME